MANLNINRWLQSRAYKKARALVASIISSPGGLFKLVAAAQTKFSKSENRQINGSGQTGRFGEILGSTSAALRLLKAYAAGTYRDISLESLGLIVASIVYFVMPIDALPDFILALGLTDDAALIAWTLRSVSDDIDRFTTWESTQTDATPESEQQGRSADSVDPTDDTKS